MFWFSFAVAQQYKQLIKKFRENVNSQTFFLNWTGKKLKTSNELFEKGLARLIIWRNWRP